MRWFGGCTKEVRAKYKGGSVVVKIHEQVFLIIDSTGIGVYCSLSIDKCILRLCNQRVCYLLY